jgi:hypothetical protein
MTRTLALLLFATAPAFTLAFTPAFAAPADCPQAGDQLSELLASAKQRVGRDGEVRVEFDVDARGRPQLVALAGTRSYQVPVRLALASLDCRSGEPQRYVLNIRFADPLAVLAAAPAASVAQAATPR